MLGRVAQAPAEMLRKRACSGSPWPSAVAPEAGADSGFSFPSSGQMLGEAQGPCSVHPWRPLGAGWAVSGHDGAT